MNGPHCRCHPEYVRHFLEQKTHCVRNSQSRCTHARVMFLNATKNGSFYMKYFLQTLRFSLVHRIPSVLSVEQQATG